MQKKININIAVDVIGALSDKKLDKYIFLMDDSMLDSKCQGTKFLETICISGQIIKWKVCAIDLQTPVSIKKIFFKSNNHEEYNGESFEFVEKNSPDLNVWEGIVPGHMEKGFSYKYNIQLQMGEGKESIMSIDTPSLLRL